MNNATAFQPDWVSPPGETISDVLRDRNLSMSALASAMRVSSGYVEDLLAGRAPIDRDIAQRLHRTLGASTEFWLTRERQYRADSVRLRPSLVAADNKQWIRTLPVGNMIKFGWIPPARTGAEKIEACLKFFGVPDALTWQSTHQETLRRAAFRTSPSLASNPASVAAWLRQGERECSEIACSPWNSTRFRELLPHLRSLTSDKDPARFLPRLREACARAGVAVAIVRAPTGCRASGATQFLTPEKAMILLSFRFLSDDQFWFSFFHEAGHLLLHDPSRLFLEEDAVSGENYELEANRFSADILIPPHLQGGLRSLRLTAKAIIRFAVRVQISPGIIVGQLQHLGRLRPNQLNSLKRRYKWL